MTLKQRPAVRAILIDQAHRILLLKGHDSTVVNSQHWWFTVGGGIRSDETSREALRREVLEETGRLVTNIQETPFSRISRFIFEGREYLQHETFYMVKSEAFDPNPTCLTPMEQRSIIGHKWWTIEELQETAETVYPSQLASWLEFLIESRLAP